MTIALAIRDVRRSFYGAKVLRGVDFDIPTGEITGLIGPNGAGKSTLFNVVSGLYRPDGGSIMVDGAECAGERPDALVRRGLVRTFQLARGFPKLSVFQHLMLYGPRQPGERLIEEISVLRSYVNDASSSDAGFEVLSPPLRDRMQNGG